ncbi:MAG: hypothetical protein ACJAXE_000369 [Neolewinella sp.]|jgi:uncharacterized protein YdiU (UPF0061 family)
MNLNIKDTFNKELPHDLNRQNSRRQVLNACFSYVIPRLPSSPTLVHASDEVMKEIGLDEKDENSEDFLSVFSGKKLLEGTDPYAMCYGGHQFGNWAGQLGDGRAINLGEVVNGAKRWALQLKGAGATPYSRSADGLAVLRSSVREHLCSEAMFHLGVPTTRSLSLMLTGDKVLRDVLYDGNSAYEKGAVVCRVAPSFIRFGNFQILAARKDMASLKKLADHTIRHFFPHLKEGTKNGYVDFFREVTNRSLDMVVHWQRVGFVHGVMNTDNMSILGLTIDYGPYGWLEGYDAGWTPNTTDGQGKRYQFGNQPGVVMWNLAQLGSAIAPLINEIEPLEAVLKDFKEKYVAAYTKMMGQKLGLEVRSGSNAALIQELEAVLPVTEVDMTIFFRNLAKFSKEGHTDDGAAFLNPIIDAFYEPEDLKGEVLEAWREWFTKYFNRLNEDGISDEERRVAMDQVNPKYVFRNYMAQMAIEKADNNDFSLVDELYLLLKQPYGEQPDQQKWFAKRPEWARHKVGCSMLSCSS